MNAEEEENPAAKRLREFAHFHDLDQDVVKNLGFVKVSDGDLFDHLNIVNTARVHSYMFNDPHKQRGEPGVLDGGVNADIYETHLSFPEFVLDFLIKKFSAHKYVNQAAWNLLYMMEKYRSEYALIKIFALFLREKYGNQDLIFFLFARNTIYKEVSLFTYEHGLQNRRTNKVLDSKQRPFKSNSRRATRIVSKADNHKILDLFNGNLVSGISSKVIGKDIEHHFLTVAQCFSCGESIFNRHPKMKFQFIRKVQQEMERLYSHEQA